MQDYIGYVAAPTTLDFIAVGRISVFAPYPRALVTVKDDVTGVPVPGYCLFVAAGLTTPCDGDVGSEDGVILTGKLNPGQIYAMSLTIGGALGYSIVTGQQLITGTEFCGPSGYLFGSQQSGRSPCRDRTQNPGCRSRWRSHPKQCRSFRHFFDSLPENFARTACLEQRSVRVP